MTSHPSPFSSLRPRALFLLALMAHALLLQTAPVLAASRGSSPSEQTDTDRQEEDRSTREKQVRLRLRGSGIVDQLQSLLSASAPDFEEDLGNSASNSERRAKLLSHALYAAEHDDYEMALDYLRELLIRTLQGEAVIDSKIQNTSDLQRRIRFLKDQRRADLLRGAFTYANHESYKTALDYLGELLIRALRGEEVIDSKIQEGLREGRGIPRENFLAGQRVRIDVSESPRTTGDLIVPLPDQQVRVARLRQILYITQATVDDGVMTLVNKKQNSHYSEILATSSPLLGCLSGLIYAISCLEPTPGRIIEKVVLTLFMGVVGLNGGLIGGFVVLGIFDVLYNSHIDRAAARDLWATMADSIDSTLDAAPDLKASREFRQLSQALRKGNTQKANSIATQMACDHALGGSQLNLLYPSSTPITSASHDQQGESAEGQLTETAAPDVVEVDQSSSPGKTTL